MKSIMLRAAALAAFLVIPSTLSLLGTVDFKKPATLATIPYSANPAASAFSRVAPIAPIIDAQKFVQLITAGVSLPPGMSRHELSAAALDE